MVDDISIIFDGPFSSVMELIGEMAAVYPKNMPLNIQISFGYSRFLDCHINNYLQKSAVNKITTSLAYKQLAKFDYVPFSSNISPTYKGCVVPSFLHRVRERCSLSGDRIHHLENLKLVLKHRNQNMRAINARIKRFYSRQNAGRITKLNRGSRITRIKFDAVSKMHQYSKSCLLASYRAAGLTPRFVYTSLPRVLSKFYSKRAVVKKVKATLQK